MNPQCSILLSLYHYRLLAQIRCGINSRVSMTENNTSDGLNVYFSVLTAQFGQWLEVLCRGRNVRQWQVTAGLISGQVKKSYRRRKLYGFPTS
jgi:hypothetical protein